MGPPDDIGATEDAEMPGIALPATTGLWCVLGYLGLGALAVAVGGRRIATPLIYGGALAVALVALGAALTCFLAAAPPWTLVLPIGLPGIGARFRVDALSAFFLVVVNLAQRSRASTRSAMDDTRKRRPGCFHFMQPSWPA